MREMKNTYTILIGNTIEKITLLSQIFWEVVGLERGPLSHVSTTEELLDRKVGAPV
jgi:hypothetical protein